MKKFVSFIFLILLSCSKDSPTPIEQLTYALTVSASEGGSVDNTGGIHNENIDVIITATPAAGFTFSGWSGSADGTTNPLTVNMTSDKSITANFIRSKYTLIVGQVGEGTITETIISSDKNSEEYNSGTVVRLNAAPQTGWIFNSWSGSSTETTNQIDITIDGTKIVTATFEEQITQVTTAGVFTGIGKWEFRNSSQNSSSNKSAACQISSIIFRTNGSFTIGVLSTGTSVGSNVTGQYSVDSDTAISLTIAETTFSTGTSSSTTKQIPFGSISNLVLTNSLINFSIQLNSGCSGDLEAEKDEYYEEEKDTYLPPVITLTGSTVIELSVGDTFTDPGATATDAVDGDLTSSITSSGTVDTSVAGFYAILYAVTDAAGNAASVYREINVRAAADTTAPVITLTGSIIIELTVGDTYSDPGVTANDDVDGDITSSITSSGTVDTSVAGFYAVLFSVTDAAGNAASVYREINVRAAADTTAPVITLTGSIIIELTVGDTYSDPGVTANDDVDGDITSSITSSGTVDTSVAGFYAVLFSVTDAAGNAASVYREINVRAAADTTAPVITLTGSIIIELTVGDTYSDPGVTANDDVDGDITSSITSSGTVDTSVAGFYAVLFSVTDAAGNAASVYREINVRAAADTTAPVITLTGSIIIELTVGDTYSDPGVTANDDVDGDITSSITSSGTVDTSVAGFYAVLFSVTDAAGNAASVYREINVRAAATTYSISVTASSNSDYTLSGTDVNGIVSGDDVSITINKGDTLSFDVNAPNHPFYIKTVQGTGTDNQVSNVTNNGTIGGVVNWTPTVAGTYYYQCSVHDGMYGTITVQ